MSASRLLRSQGPGVHVVKRILYDILEMILNPSEPFILGFKAAGHCSEFDPQGIGDASRTDDDVPCHSSELVRVHNAILWAQHDRLKIQRTRLSRKAPRISTSPPRVSADPVESPPVGLHQVFLDQDGFGNTVIQVKTISFKVSEDEARRIRLLARRERLSVSEFLRRRAMGTARVEEPGKVRCEHTGAEIFAPLAGQSPLTTAEVKEILADYP